MFDLEVWDIVWNKYVPVDSKYHFGKVIKKSTTIKKARLPVKFDGISLYREWEQKRITVKYEWKTAKYKDNNELYYDWTPFLYKKPELGL